MAELETQWFEALDYLRSFRLIDSEYEINRLLLEGKSVLAEGAQGIEDVHDRHHGGEHHGGRGQLPDP